MKIKNIIFITVFLVLIFAGIYFYMQVKQALKYDYFFTGLKFNSVNLDEIDGIVDMRISNPSNVQLDISEVDLKIYFNSVFISSLKTKAPFSIFSRDYFDVPLNFNANPSKILSFRNLIQLQTFVTDSETIVTITGKIKVKKGFIKFSVPVYFNEPLSYFL